MNEIETRIDELGNAMVIVELLGGVSPEQTAVIVALGKRMRELKEAGVCSRCGDSLAASLHGEGLRSPDLQPLGFK